MNKELTALLDRQSSSLSSIISGNAVHIERLLSHHRCQVAELLLRESPEPFVREIFDRLRNNLQAVITSEPGSADAEDARCLLRIINRMEKEIKGG